MVRTQVLPKSAVMPSIQFNPSVRLCTVDTSMMGLGICWGATTSGSCITCLWSFWQSLSLSQNRATPSQYPSTLLPLPLVCFFLHPFPTSSILYPSPSGPCENSQLPETREVLMVWTWTWNMQNTGALTKGHAEMWLNASAGCKKPPQDQCNYESFTWRTFQAL